MKSDCVKYDCNRQILKLDFPRYKQIIDDELIFVKGFFTNVVDPKTFPDEWHDVIKPLFLHWAYRNYPNNDKLIHDYTSNKYNFEKWSPGDYPILHVHPSYFKSHNWLATAISTLPKDAAINALRYATPLAVQNDKSFRLQKYREDFLEALVFDDEIPDTVTVSCNNIHFEFKPDSLYLFLGMIPVSVCEFTTFEITLHYEHVEDSYSIGLIGWLMPGSFAKSIKQFQSIFETPNRMTSVSFKSEGPLGCYSDYIKN